MKVSPRTISRLLSIERKLRHDAIEAQYYEDKLVEILLSLEEKQPKEKKLLLLENSITNNKTEACENEICNLFHDQRILGRRNVLNNTEEIYTTYKKYISSIIGNRKVKFSPHLNFISRLIIEIIKLESSSSELPIYNITSESDSINIFFNTIGWIEDNIILEKHLHILQEKGVIEFDHLKEVLTLKKRPDIRSKDSYVEAICLFKFWEIFKFIIISKRPWARIRNSFTEKGGKEYSIGQLKTQGNSLKEMGFFNEHKGETIHPRIKYFQKILN